MTKPDAVQINAIDMLDDALASLTAIVHAALMCLDNVPGSPLLISGDDFRQLISIALDKTAEAKAARNNLWK